MTYRVFYHIACMNHWATVVQEQLSLLAASDLSKSAVQVGILGTERDCELVRQIAKSNAVAVEIVFQNPDLRHYELPTLLCLERWARQAADDDAVFYFHTKGVAFPGPYREQWRQLMHRQLIPLWRDHLEDLKSFDVIGVNWMDKGPAGGCKGSDFWKGHPHFSGNFWWARAGWIKKLPPLQAYYDHPTFPFLTADSIRLGCEFWIGSGKSPRVKSLYCRDREFLDCASLVQ